MNSFERNAHGCGYQRIAGIDEAGRGPLAGPVIAAAVILPPEYERSRDQRFQETDPPAAGKALRGHSAGCGFRRHRRRRGAGDRCREYPAGDARRHEGGGSRSFPLSRLSSDRRSEPDIDLPFPRKPSSAAMAWSLSVASASIVAKVSRDRLMEMYHRQFPQYNFFRNKGYGTREHREAIPDTAVARFTAARSGLPKSMTCRSMQPWASEEVPNPPSSFTHGSFARITQTKRNYLFPLRIDAFSAACSRRTLINGKRLPCR